MPPDQPSPPQDNPPAASRQSWFRRLNLFGLGERDRLQDRLAQQEGQIRLLNEQLEAERKRSNQLALLSEIEQSLKIVLDPPVAAQWVVAAIQHALNCDAVTVLIHDGEQKEFRVLAVAGKARWYLPPAFPLRADQGLIGRAVRQRKTILANDTRLEKDYLPPEGRGFLSEMIVPLIENGELKGVLTVDYEKAGALSATDATTLEVAAEQLVSAWERSNYHQHLTGLIQGGISLSKLQDSQAVIDEVAVIAQKTLEARFSLVSLLDQDGGFASTAHAGTAPQLLRSLRQNPADNPLIQKVMNAGSILRIRDLRKSKLAARLKMEPMNFQGLLAIPIRLHQLNIGFILAFGKHRQATFTENDESLANLIASQAAAAIESAWLYQELRATLDTATLLYQLNLNVSQAKNLQKAAETIAETAYKLNYSARTGVVLLTPDEGVRIQVDADETGLQPAKDFPGEIVEAALQTRQAVVVSAPEAPVKVCLPLQTPHKIYGALWLELPENRRYSSRCSADFQSLANQATTALERSLLLAQTSGQAKQLEAAYHELEMTYDQTLASLVSALDARDRETEGHSTRVGKIATRLGEQLDLTARQVKALERGALLHDIGKIGISDTILLKPGPLTDEEWQVMRNHPEIGARIVEGIPFLAETTPIIRYHHEHWDGSGYPIGLAGEEIPLLARVFAIADAFDAMMSDRPYRKGTTEKEAANYLQAKMGLLYDPEIVGVFIEMLKQQLFADILRR